MLASSMKTVDTIYGKKYLITREREACRADLFKYADFPLKAKECYLGWGVFGRTGYNVLASRKHGTFANTTNKTIAKRLAKRWTRIGK